MGPHPRHQSQGRFLLGSGRRSPDEGGQARRRHHQCVFADVGGWRSDRHALRFVEVGPARHDARPIGRVEPLNIRVNAIAPGYFRTDMTQVFYANSEWRTGMLRRIPQARFGEMSDLQGVAVFLASDAAKYITGQCIAVDGGYLASI